VGSKAHSVRCPLLEVVLEGDSAAAAPRGSDAEVLVEGRGSLDGRLVDLLVLPDGVCSAVTCESPLDGSLLRRVLGIFHDVIFNKRIGGPAID